jgi:hypothetical protein
MTATTSPRWFPLCLALAAGVALVGCDHATDFEGPRLIDRFGDFALLDTLEASREAVDFAGGEDVFFTARFNKQVNWVVEIVGQQSGAVKRIEGFSAEVGEENARWLGGTTELPLFKEEPVEASLFVPDEESDTTRATIEVLAPRAYPGEVITGFEDDDEAELFLGNFEFELDAASGLSTEVPAAEGDAFYLLRGTDTVVDNFFVGLVQITSSSESGYFAVPTSAPEDLFFNAFLYNFGSDNTIVILEVIADANGNGRFDDGTDTVFSSGDIVLEEPGWVPFSRSIAEFGLSQAQAQEVVAVRAVLISNNNTQPSPRLPVDFGIDYLTFTEGGPLQLSPTP